jgi:sulfate transport system ATP-binding protein
MSFVGAVNVISSDNDFIPEQDAPPIPTDFFIRPHDIQLSATTESSVSAEVARIIHLGWEIRVELSLNNGQIIFAHLNREQWSKLHLEVGDKVFVKSKDIKVFPKYRQPEYSRSSY